MCDVLNSKHGNIYTTFYTVIYQTEDKYELDETNNFKDAFNLISSNIERDKLTSIKMVQVDDFNVLMF